ncbi:serine/threonine protein kinase [Stieleria neptunia]|uniref:serine/threonine protein kinase n=1 Tax=Stieleria neptunia TaxID=2527979 RepID=UPI0018D20186|nr:serine/threonine-protein kinase [Stieleria neptunia]
MNDPTIQYPIHQPSSSVDPWHASEQSESESQSDGWKGRVIGEYEIQRLIGQGAYGHVYHAMHRWLKLPVAIKVLQHVDTNDRQSLDRFQREAQIAARLRHPNLVRCTDGGIVGEKTFLVTDFVDGVDLRTLVRRLGPLTVAEASEIIRQTAVALQFIVDNHTIHRDIKPANIMLDSTGNVRVLDLGLARCAITGETLTETGQIMGTLDYIAPEQAVDSRHVDFRADLYSLGCTFYFLLTGQAPFSSSENSSLASKILAHLESDPPPIKQFRRDVPRPLIALINQMLDKSPELRPDSFRSVCGALAPYAQRDNLEGLLTRTGDHANRTGRQAPKRVSRWAEQMVEGITAAVITLLRFTLVVLGFLDRKSRRTGQKPSYHFSFRWLKSAMALGALGFVIWFSGIEIVPAESFTGSLFETRTNEPSSIKHSPFTPVQSPTHGQPPTGEALPQTHRPPHLQPPHLQPPAHPRQPHGPVPPRPPAPSQGVQYNEYQ